VRRYLRCRVQVTVRRGIFRVPVVALSRLVRHTLATVAYTRERHTMS